MFWGVQGPKLPGWKERLLKEVNISFLTMPKPFQSYQNPSKHAKTHLKIKKLKKMHQF